MVLTGIMPLKRLARRLSSHRPNISTRLRSSNNLNNISIKPLNLNNRGDQPSLSTKGTQLKSQPLNLDSRLNRRINSISTRQNRPKRSSRSLRTTCRRWGRSILDMT